MGDTILTLQADWEANVVTHDDTEVSGDAVGLRSQDTLVDRPTWYGAVEAPVYEDSTTVPPGSGYTISRRVVTFNHSDFPNPQEHASANRVGKRFTIGYDGGLFQPSVIEFWLRTPYHDSGLYSNTNYQYPFAMLINDAQSFALEGDLMTWLALDTHDPHGHGRFLFGSADGDYSSSWFGWITDTYEQADIHNVWIKCKVEFDWANRLFRWYLDDVLQDYVRRLDDTDSGRFLEDYLIGDPNAHANRTITDGWMEPFNDNGFADDANGAIGFHVQTPYFFTNAVEGWDGNTTVDPNFGPMEGWLCSDLCKMRIKDGSCVIDIPIPASPTTVRGATLAWTSSTVTNTNLTFVASRSFSNDVNRVAASSYVGTDLPSNAILTIGNYHDKRVRDLVASYYWIRRIWKASTADAWWRYHLDLPRALNFFIVEGRNLDNVTILGSNTDTIVGAATIYTGSIAQQPGSQNFNWYDKIQAINDTEYEYYWFRFVGTTGNPELHDIQLRDAHVRPAAVWTAVNVEARVSPDGGSTWGNWNAVNPITGVVRGFPAEIAVANLKIEARVTLTTDNQQYRPVLDSLTLTTQDTANITTAPPTTVPPTTLAPTTGAPTTAAATTPAPTTPVPTTPVPTTPAPTTGAPTTAVPTTAPPIDAAFYFDDTTAFAFVDTSAYEWSPHQGGLPSTTGIPTTAAPEGFGEITDPGYISLHTIREYISLGNAMTYITIPRLRGYISMRSTAAEELYLPYDPKIVICLTDNGVVEDVSLATRFKFIIGSLILDSQAEPTKFDNTQHVTSAEAAEVEGITAGQHKLIIDLGAETITDGIYTAKLIVYDADHTGGVMWCKIPVVVENIVEGV